MKKQAGLVNPLSECTFLSGFKISVGYTITLTELNDFFASSKDKYTFHDFITGSVVYTGRDKGDGLSFFSDVFFSY